MNPLSDGGQFTGVSDIIGKYGLVPKSVMTETFSSDNTGKMSNLIGLKLKEFGLQLREAAAAGAKPAELEKKKTEMLADTRRTGVYIHLELEGRRSERIYSAVVLQGISGQ